MKKFTRSEVEDIQIVFGVLAVVVSLVLVCSLIHSNIESLIEFWFAIDKLIPETFGILFTIVLSILSFTCSSLSSILYSRFLGFCLWGFGILLFGSSTLFVFTEPDDSISILDGWILFGALLMCIVNMMFLNWKIFTED